MFDLGTMAWTRFSRPAPRRPAAREDAAWAYDARAARLILFGGWADEWLGDAVALDVSAVVGPPYAAYAVDPSAGPLVGGTRFIVRGTGFPDSREARVLFTDGRTEALATGHRVGPTEVSGVAPAWDGSAGPVEVRVSFGEEGFTVNRVRWEYFASAQADRCVAFGPGLQPGPAGLRWGTPAEFRVVARDAAGRRRASGGDPLVISVRRLDGTPEEASRIGPEPGTDAGAGVRVVVSDRGDGAYDCRYTPQRRGLYMVAVGLAESPGAAGGPPVPIQGSPWVVEATIDPWVRTRALGSAHALAVTRGSRPQPVLCVQGRQLLVWAEEGGGDGEEAGDGTNDEFGVGVEAEERQARKSVPAIQVLRLFDGAALRWDAPVVRGDGPDAVAGFHLVALDERSAVALKDVSLPDSRVYDRDGAEPAVLLRREQIGLRWEDVALTHAADSEDCKLTEHFGRWTIHCLLSSAGGQRVTKSCTLVICESDSSLDGGAVACRFFLVTASGSRQIKCEEVKGPVLSVAGNSGCSRQGLRRFGVAATRQNEVVFLVCDEIGESAQVFVGERTLDGSLFWKLQAASGDMPNK